MHARNNSCKLAIRLSKLAQSHCILYVKSFSDDVQQSAWLPFSKSSPSQGFPTWEYIQTLQKHPSDCSLKFSPIMFFFWLPVISVATEMTKLKSSAPLVEILEAMRHPQTGVGFLTQHPSLPSQTFVSADAVQWLNGHIEAGLTLEQAINIMKVQPLPLAPTRFLIQYDWEQCFYCFALGCREWFRRDWSVTRQATFPSLLFWDFICIILYRIRMVRKVNLNVSLALQRSVNGIVIMINKSFLFVRCRLLSSSGWSAEFRKRMGGSGDESP